MPARQWEAASRWPAAQSSGSHARAPRHTGAGGGRAPRCSCLRRRHAPTSRAGRPPQPCKLRAADWGSRQEPMGAPGTDTRQTAASTERQGKGSLEAALNEGGAVGLYVHVNVHVCIIQKRSVALHLRSRASASSSAPRASRSWPHACASGQEPSRAHSVLECAAPHAVPHVAQAVRQSSGRLR